MMHQGKPWLTQHQTQEDVGVFTYTDAKGNEHKFEIGTGPGNAYGTVIVGSTTTTVDGLPLCMIKKESFTHRNAGVVAEAVLARYKEIHKL